MKVLIDVQQNDDVTVGGCNNDAKHEEIRRTVQPERDYRSTDF